MAEQDAAILLADASGSTALYQREGDARASQLVVACIEAQTAICEGQGGRFIRSKGDDLLCLFPEPIQAMSAARAILARGAVGGVTLHSGLHWGSVVHHGDDIFGNAINIAARLASKAKSGEILISETLVRHLPVDARQDLRAMGPMTLRGAEEPVHVHALLHPDQGLTTIPLTLPGRATRPAQVPSGARLRLTHGQDVLDITEGQSLSIGRAATNDLVLAEPWISRIHATIAVRQGYAVLTDQSAAGCAVQVSGQERIFVNRDAIMLNGSGVILMGGPNGGSDAPALLFDVTQGR